MVDNVFVVGADDFNLAQLKTVPSARDCSFHVLSRYGEIKGEHRLPIETHLERARRDLREFPGTIDAIVGWWDFPVSTILPILAREFGAPAPSLESVLKCEHKYWSRLEQMRSVPEYVPKFVLVDPFNETAADRIRLPFPFWIKPVKSASSYLGFKVCNRDELRRDLVTMRENIHYFAEPFNHVLAQADLPAEVAVADGFHCIAEEIISRGRQCTLEGYAHDGDVAVYGVVDSMRSGKHRSCFSRYQYPSTLPRRVKRRMIAATERFIKHIEYDNAPFNIEFYWDAGGDTIWLLEVNTRISKSHCPLFRMVDGASHQQVMLAVALGRQPRFPHRQGPFKVAAKFMPRRYRDATVTRIPAPVDIEAVAARFPGTEIELHVHEGMRLSELRGQDSYSYEIAALFMGANSQKALLSNYRTAMAMLGFRFSDDPA
jgi:biotin carboxylase